ncbi:MAG6090-like repeat-containing lipoprotein, partial [Mycoplasmopsis agalactiae]|uniref:MAG6090-like repeat-containing lipoprotein n=1 Tax=Mycoplasmopsis agalactiae TaxID=2110 RepID=UPI003B512A7E
MSGLDIDIHPSKAEIKSEEKRLQDLVNKILEDIKKNNEKILNFRSQWKSKFRDSISGLDISDLQLIDPWWIAYKKYEDLLIRQINKELEEVKKIRKEIADAINKIAKIQSEIRAKKMAESASKLTKELFDDSNADKVKKAEERYAAELVDKLDKHTDYLISLIEITKELFGDEFSSLAKEAVERYKKHGDKHSFEAANETAEIFSDEFSKLVKESIARYERHGNKHSSESAKETAELFSDDFSKLVKAAVERYKKHGDKHSSESAKETAEIFEDEFSNLAKEAVERYKKHGDKHSFES